MHVTCHTSTHEPIDALIVTVCRGSHTHLIWGRLIWQLDPSDYRGFAGIFQERSGASKRQTAAGFDVDHRHRVDVPKEQSRRLERGGVGCRLSFVSPLKSDVLEYSLRCPKLPGGN